MTQPIPWDPMAPSATLEQQAQTLQTQAFIAANPVSIAVQRATLVKTAAGGRKRSDPQTLDPQLVRLVPLGTTAARGQEGEQPRVEFTLIALPDADIKRGDRFKIFGDDDSPWYSIPYKLDSFPYELRAEVYLDK